MSGDVIIYESHLAVYRHSLDLIFYILGTALENELMLHGALSAFHDAVSMLLRNQLEKRSLLENLDLVLLCLDETIDDGCVHLAIYWFITSSILFAHLESMHQGHSGDRLGSHCVSSEQAPSRYHRYRYQRADATKRISNRQGACSATDAAILRCIHNHLPLCKRLIY